MPIKLFNTLTRKKEVFKPLHNKKVGFYTCGPTVYNYAHIGNLRTYIFEDILRRTLEYNGYKVKHIMNITDIEDKIIKNSLEQGKNIYEFTAPYEKAFLEDLQKLNIKRADKYPKATEHIKEMVKIIEKLLKSGVAYEADKSIYFNISKFKNYGKLSKINKKSLKAGVRVSADEYKKDDVQDFALWKTKKNNEPSWNTPFGKGRPGWHIECSAMSAAYLGQPFDIHAGGVDLIFPHHENEIAQSEAALKKPFANFFVHGEHLLVNNEKMSKSLGNIYTLRDIENKKFNPLTFRYLVFSSNYRAKLNFTWESLQAAENSLNHLYDFIKNLQYEIKSKKNNNNDEKANFLNKIKSDFENAVFNDLNTPKALSSVWKLINEYNKSLTFSKKVSDKSPRKFNYKSVLNIVYEFDKILGLNLKKIKIEAVPKEVNMLVKERDKSRKNKNWQKADEIREKLKKIGWMVEDMGQKTRIIRIKN